MSIIKEMMYLQEVPFWIEENAKKGYVEFHISLKDSKKPRRERVVVKAWRRAPPTGGSVCPTCGVICRNPVVLDLHMKQRKHGPYREATS